MDVRKITIEQIKLDLERNGDDKRLQRPGQIPIKKNFYRKPQLSIKQKNGLPNSMATAGLVTSIIGLVIGILAWLINVILLLNL